MKKEKLKGHIKKQYGIIARNEQNSCCVNSCGCSGNNDISDISKMLGYSENDFFDIPYEANMGLGCGNPTAFALLKKGEVVLDLGSGGGIDCFLARKLVGEEGFVYGVDMTIDMIELANKNLEKSKYKNIEFRLGEIESLPINDNVIDVIISNCVINLSVDKRLVFKESYRVLKKNGRLSISDIVEIKPLPKIYKKDLNLISSCISGASNIEDIRKILEEVGFYNIKLTIKENSKEIISNWVPNKGLEDYIVSVMIEATK